MAITFVRSGVFPAIGIGMAAVVVGVTLALRGVSRRRQLAGTRDQVPSGMLKHIDAELEDAEERARRAGAQEPLTFIGAGMTGIVFCDPTGRAFKVSRKGVRDPDQTALSTLSDEAAWLEAASKIRGVREHIAKVERYDADNHVIVRECVQPTKKSRPWRYNEDRLCKLHDRIGQTMRRYGWTAPEYKPDSYVYTDRGPILVDAGFVHRRGQALVQDVLDVLNDRRKLWRREKLTDLAWELRMERGDSIPAPVANKLLVRLQAIDPDVEL